MVSSSLSVDDGGVQALRADRILHEAISTGGDPQVHCDLSGLSIGYARLISPHAIGDAGQVSTNFVLIHSPLVGSVTWSWVADELHERGHRAVTPSIAAGALAGNWQTCVQLAVEQAQTDPDAILVGHSGAGPLLPSIAAEMSQRPAQLVFVDAGLPPTRGEARVVPDNFAEHLRALADDGLLPVWSDWFGPGVVDSLILDAERRAAVLANLPRLPLSYFDARIAMPQGWSAAAQGAYVLLSEMYRPDADEAASRGWPVIETLGGHLDLINRPAELAEALIGLTLP